MTAAVAFLVYLAAAGLFSLPLWLPGHALIPGGLEDTRLFLWNAWWGYHAWTAHVPLYDTPMLFHPFGVSLITHDMPLWMTLVTDAAQSAGLSLIRAVDVWFALTWALNGFCAFLLAREVTGRRAPAFVAGLFVMTHAYTLARAMENWGQFDLYALPLFLWLLLRARRRGGLASSLLAGAALAWTAACHYYFFVYAVLVWMAVVVLDLSPWGICVERQHGPRLTACRGDEALITLRHTPSPRHPPRLLAGDPRCRLIFSFICMGVGGLLAAWIVIGKPMSITIQNHPIGLESPANALLVFWVGLFVWLSARWQFMIEPRIARASARPVHGLLGISSALFLTPLLLKAVPVMLRGDYPRQHILWKTHVLGANLLALFAPNPLHVLWGARVSAWFTHAQLDPQEQAAMIGWVCLAVVLGSGVWRAGAPLRRWLALAIAATVLSMGVYLHIGAANLWCPLPFYVTRLLPLLENVRVPERWMALGATAWAVVLAGGLIRLAARKSWALNRVCVVAALLILAENWPGIPYAAVPAPSPVLTRLRQEPAGAVLALPFYVGDSSVGAGDALPTIHPFPWQHLLDQTIHEKPIVGGYVGRIPRRLLRAYTRDPYWGRLIRLEEGALIVDPDPTAGQIRHAVQDARVSYCLIYPAAIHPAALAFVRRTLPLELIASDGDVELDRISH